MQINFSVFCRKFLDLFPNRILKVSSVLVGCLQYLNTNAEMAFQNSIAAEPFEIRHLRIRN